MPLTDEFRRQLEKHSPTLNRTAHYNTTMEISRLPPYVIMQYMRFYWRTDTNKKVCEYFVISLVCWQRDDDSSCPFSALLAKLAGNMLKCNPGVFSAGQDLQECSFSSRH